MFQSQVGILSLSQDSVATQKTTFMTSIKIRKKFTTF